MKKTTLIHKSGFTLIELLVTMTIIAVLAIVGVVNFTSASKSARDGRRKTDLEAVRQAFVLYKSQKGNYTVTNLSSTQDATNFNTDLVPALTTAGYLSDPAPVDPNGKKSYTASGTASEFCLCATVDNTLNGNTVTQSCASIVSPSATTAYYCVQEP